MTKTLMFFFPVFWLAGLAQETVVTRKVQDLFKGNMIANANIVVLNSQIGAITDVNGKYELKGLAPGTYEISVSYIGYAAQKKDITIGPEPVKLDFVLATEAVALNEVILKGVVKREVPLLKVPSSVTTLNESEIADLRLWNVRDMSGLSANVQAVNAGEAEGITFSVRGIGALNFDPSVVTYVDGINQFDIYSSIDYIHNIESIEVLKGPQGTLFGRNAMGGVINITTKQPNNFYRAELEATYGNFGLQRYNLFASGPLVKDKLFFSVGALFNDREGFFTNTFDDSNFNGTTHGGGTISLKYRVNDNWSFTIMGKRYERRIDGYLPFAASDSIAFANPFETQQNAPGKVRNSINQAALTVKHTGRNINFTNVFAYQDRDYALDNVDVDFSPADINTYSLGIPGFSNVVNAFTNEFSFSNPASSKKVKWIAGSYAFWQEVPANDIISSGEDAAAFDPTAPNQVIGLRDGTNRGIAFFGQASYAISPKIEISGGLRYDFEKREITSQTDFAQEGAPASTVVPRENRENSFSAFLPKASISWFASENTTLYASYSKGYRVGGINPSDNPDFIGFDPETSDNYEIGIKGNLLKKRLRFGLSGFFIDRTNIQSNVFEPGSNGLRFATLSNGDGRNIGLELELGYLVFKGLQLRYDLGYLNAKYTRLEAPDFVTGENRTLNDRTVIQSPEFTSNLVLDYSSPLEIGKQKITISANTRLTTIGEQFYDFENTVSQPAYTILNARLGASFKGFGLYLWAQNLTDERYLAFVPFTGANTAFLGNPRTYGFAISYDLLN